MRAVIFQHMTAGGPGTLQAALTAQGFSCQTIYTVYDDISSFDALAADILVVMGGAPGVYQADSYTFLKQEQRILERRLAADKPTIGICLGAQLMAAALGARVFKGPQGPEIGWLDLSLTAAGVDSPTQVFADKKILQWHGDTFDLPQSATLLASSVLYENQIFKHGHNTIGFQGHIEVTDHSLAQWFVEDAAMMLRHPGLLEILRRDTAQYAAHMTNATKIFMNNWLATVLPPPGGNHA